MLSIPKTWGRVGEDGSSGRKEDTRAETEERLKLRENRQKLKMTAYSSEALVSSPFSSCREWIKLCCMKKKICIYMR